MRFIALVVSFALIASHADARLFHRRASHPVKPHGRANIVATRANPVTTFDNSVGNPRYAALVLDADTGETLYERNSHEHRYPASLTKMMTLYLTFDALKSGRLTLDQQLTASKKAASMPQTNVALRPGSHIKVDTAIRALTVRSANDVAVVLAEQIGGSEWNFAMMMTAKAHQLGMNDTVFHNANGLPDTRQYTSAYDLAILGRALRRDFPQYYAYFSARSFDYAGRTYPGHNRVLDRLPGVDGIKTGFINASGFNLVSSLKNNGVSIVAVVMGGYTGASRDNEMVKLLKQYYTVVAERHQNPRYYAAKPAVPQLVAAANPAAVPAIAGVAPPPIPVAPNAVSSAVAKPVPLVVAASIPRAAAVSAAPDRTIAAPEASLPVPSKPASSGNPPAALVSSNAPKAAPAPVLARAPTGPTPSATLISFNPKAKAGNTLEYQFAMLNTAAASSPPAAAPATPEGGKIWAVQVGAFKSQKQANDALASAKGNVAELKNAAVNITNDGNSDDPIHRARLANLTKSDAENACRKLNAMNASCFPLRVN